MQAIRISVHASISGFDVRENGNLCASFLRLFEARRYAFKRGNGYARIGVPVSMSGVLGQ